MLTPRKSSISLISQRVPVPSRRSHSSRTDSLLSVVLPVVNSPKNQDPSIFQVISPAKQPASLLSTTVSNVPPVSSVTPPVYPSSLSTTPVNSSKQLQPKLKSPNLSSTVSFSTGVFSQNVRRNISNDLPMAPSLSDPKLCDVLSKNVNFNELQQRGGNFLNSVM